MSILPDQINLAEIAYLAFQSDEETEIQTRIVKARELEAGYFDSELAAELQEKALLGGSEADIEGVNLVSLGLNTLLRRVSIQAVNCADENQAKWLQQISRANKLLKLQRKLHKAALRDREAFLIVEYDQFKPRPWEPGQRGVPRFYVHERYTSAEVAYGDTNGSGEGCRAYYRNNDEDQDLEMIARIWTQTTYENGEPVTRQRMNLHIRPQLNTNGRVEKYIMGDDGTWQQHSDEYRDESGAVQTESWPVWLTVDGTETGEALPPDCFHFTSMDEYPAFKRAWGLQAGMDQMWSALLSGGTISGHPLLVALGFYPTTDGKEPADDGSNLMISQPRQIIGTTKSKQDADMKQIPPADPRMILDIMDKISVYFALVSGLPLKNFVFTRQVSSEGALKHGEIELIATANEATDLFEPEWIAAFEAARKLDIVFSRASWNETAEITIQWAPKEMVSQSAMKDEVDAKLAAGVPQQQIQADVFGYSEEEITQNATSNGAAAPTGTAVPAGAGEAVTA